MRFLILGPLEVQGAEGPVALGGIKPRAVLAVLLLHANEPVSSERLALALWGEDVAGGATKTVQVHVSRLRKALGGGDMISTTSAGYCLRVRPEDLDAAQFERLVEDGRRALAGGRPEQAATILREALALWRGPALAELAFEPFARAEVARLEEQRLAAVEARVEADLAMGRHAELVGELQQLVAANQTRERLTAQLMLTLYRCGRQADALAAYQDVRRVLVAEIGIEPGPELRELQEAILRQDVALDASGGVPELPPELDAATAPPLVGREDELAWLRLQWERARRGSGALILLAGERGAGKSRIAAELAGDAHRRGDTVLYAHGRAPPAAALGVLRGLAGAERPTLLVLDDAGAAGADVLGQLDASTGSLSSVPVLVLVCCVDADALAGVRSDAVLTLDPLAEDAVRSIGSRYASGKEREEVPAGWLLEASGGLPRRVHEVASQWARREAARRVTVVAGRAETERVQLRTIQDELTGGVVELQEAHERILARRAGEPSVVCPFKGLAAYEAGDSEYFFGRERLVAELVARLVGAPLLAVVGPSGSGKSSVMRAGLLPALASGVLPGSEDWERALMRPGAHPLRELGVALADREGRVVLAVDQFEETFTVCTDESERAEFISELVHAAQDPGGRYVVVLALRADYYGRCAAYPQLSSLLAANNVLVRSMQRDELRRAVEAPCGRAGLRIEDELVDALVADVEREPGGLPLLSTALLELWQRRDGRRLRHSAYVQTGGVHGAVARLAEDAFAQLDEPQQAVARGVLMRLVGAGEGDAVERRRVALEELEIERDEDVARTVALLTDRRLLTVSAGSVEFAHEALLREWPRLRGWIEEDRQGLRIQRSLSAAAREWDRLQRDEGGLYRGVRLDEAIEWRSVRTPALNELEREFLEASEDAGARERVTRRRRMGIVVAAAGTALLAVCVIAVVVLFVQRERGAAASRELARQSRAFLATDPVRALAKALEAHERRDTQQAQTAVRQATLANRAKAIIPAHKAIVYGLSVSADGRRAATSGKDGLVRVWNLDSGRLRTTIKGHAGAAQAVSLSPDGTLVASAAEDGEVAIANIDGEPRRRRLLRLGASNAARTLDYSPDGKRLVVGTIRGDVGLVPVQDVAGKLVVLGSHDERVVTARFNRAGTQVVSASDDGTSRVWDVADRDFRTLPHPEGVYGASFSPDGTRIATVGQDGKLRIWPGRAGARPLRTVAVDDSALFTVRFGEDGTRLVTAGEDGLVRLLDVRGGPLLGELRGHRDRSFDASFAGDAMTVVSVGQDGTLRTWVPLTAASLAPRPDDNVPFDPSFSSDGKRILSGYYDGDVREWNPGTRADTSLHHHADVSGAWYSVNGAYVISASADGTVRLRDVERKRSTLVPGLGDVPKRAAAIDAVGRRIAIAAEDSSVIIQARDGSGQVRLRDHGAVNALAFSRDGEHLVTASTDGTARIWSTASGDSERVLRGHDGDVLHVDYGVDGRHIVTAGADGTVRVWPVDGGRAVVLYGHEGAVNTVEFNRRGDRIVSAGADGTVRIWDAGGGEPLVVAQVHSGNASGASFSRDGEFVASAGDDGLLLSACEVCGSFAAVLRVASTRLR